MSGSDRRSSRRSRKTIGSSSATRAGGSSTTSPRRPPPTRPPEPAALIASVDGGARGNPGEAGFGVYIQDEEGSEVASLHGYLGRQTNNVAEYAGLLAALRYALAHGVRRLRIRSDSELLVRQVAGRYRVRNPTLQRLHRGALALMARLERVAVEHVRREQNREADRLVNRAIDTRGDEPAGIAAGLLD